MVNKEDMITESETLRLLQLALGRVALIYHYFCETLTDELGEQRGQDLIRKAVDAYGDHIGKEAGNKTREKGLPLTPENYESDLPDIAWETETVVVDGEERIRVHHCPLAAEWLEWGDPRKARLYCSVDQAKMRAFNPDYEYVHVKNLLDGDPYCELAIRQVEKEREPASLEAEAETESVSWLYGKYLRDDLMKMDPVCLRALFRERVHHTIEVELNPLLLGKKKMRRNLGREPELILDVWRKRGFLEDEPDFVWAKEYLSLARELRDGEQIEITEQIPAAFTDQEMEAVKKLIWQRCSTRDWLPGKEIPEETIEQILEAGRAAPNSCNLDASRFIVVRDEEEAKMVWSDIPTPMDSCVLILICYDRRVYETVGHDRLVPQNRLLDGAAAADHMCLMARALGLGAVWLTCTEKTARSFKENYGLPEYIEQVCHIAVGWPATGTIKSARMPLKEMIIKR